MGSHTLRLNFVSTVDNYDTCDMMFIPGTLNRNTLLRIFAAVKTRPVLTVGEMPQFSELGGIINFVNQEGKLRFEINRNASLRQKLKISSHLLKLAIIVDDNS